MTYIKIKITKNGKKQATYWKNGMNRSLPISIIDAELMISNESAEQVEKFFWQV